MCVDSRVYYRLGWGGERVRGEGERVGEGEREERGREKRERGGGEREERDGGNHVVPPLL